MAPTLQSTTAAGEGVTVPADLRFTVINSPNAQAYPIASQTFIVVYKDPCKAGMSQGNATALVGFLNYGLGDGQNVAKQLSYAPLPSAIAGQGEGRGGDHDLQRVGAEVADGSRRHYRARRPLGSRAVAGRPASGSPSPLGPDGAGRRRSSSCSHISSSA